MSAERSGWFEPRLSTGNIITILVLVIGLVSGWYKFDNRLTLAEDRAASSQAQAIEARARLDARITRVEADRDDIKTRVIRIEEKISGQADMLQRILRNTERSGR